MWTVEVLVYVLVVAMTPTPDALRVLLTDEERRRFIAYLENEVSIGRALISQMEATKIAEFVVKKFRSELLAAEIVLRRLQSYDEQTIRG